MAIVIKKATMDDIPDVVHVAKWLKSELGFVRRVTLERAVQSGYLYVARWQDANNDLVIGFANTYKRKDGWTTVYEIGVHPAWQRRGAGWALINVLPRPVRLKCPVDNDGANAFYDCMGFNLVRVDDGRKRKLNVWERVPYAPVKSWECPICGEDALERDHDDAYIETDWQSYIISYGTCNCPDCGACWNEKEIHFGGVDVAYIPNYGDDYVDHLLQDDADFVCAECGGHLETGDINPDWSELRPHIDRPMVLSGECRCVDCGNEYQWFWEWHTPFNEIYWDTHITMC